MLIEINNTNFEQEVLNSDVPVLIDFWASWCGPCRMLSPLVDEIADDYDDVYKVCKVNVDECEELAVKFDVVSIPTLVVMKNGIEVNRSVGLISKSDILDLFK